MLVAGHWSLDTGWNPDRSVLLPASSIKKPVASNVVKKLDSFVKFLTN